MLRQKARQVAHIYQGDRAEKRLNGLSIARYVVPMGECPAGKLVIAAEGQ